MGRFVKSRCLALVLGTIFVFSLLPLSAGGEPNLKLGYVNLQKALSLSIAGKSAADKLKEDRDSVLVEIKEKEEELKLMQEQLSKQASVLTEDALKEKREEFRKKMKDYERFRTDSVQEWERRKKELEEKILIELVKVVQGLGEEKGFSIIFAREQGILYASDSVDLTDEIIERYDAKQQQ